MKRADLVHHLLTQWCYCRPDGSFSVFLNPATQALALVPICNEISDHWSREVCRTLSVPEVPARVRATEG